MIHMKLPFNSWNTLADAKKRLTIFGGTKPKSFLVCYGPNQQISKLSAGFFGESEKLLAVAFLLDTRAKLFKK
jgi:hypothetical protein